MSINLTDELLAKTKNGKIASANQVFLEGDQENLQQIGDKTHQLEDSIKDITVTGGASTANAVSYNNETSGMTSVTAQGAIDELAAKNATKAEKAEVTAELEKKFDKESILQESGNAEDKVMSQKATSTAIADETTRAKAAEEAIIFDVSTHNNGAVFESLQALLSSPNLSTLIPTSVRHGGMSIRFIQSSDNKYVQYRLMSDSFNTTVANWQGVDDVPTARSENLVKSGGVVLKINEVNYKIEGQYFTIEHSKRFIANGYTDSLNNYACTSILIGDGSTYTFPNTNTSGCSYKVFKYISNSEGQELTSGSWSNVGTSIAINGPFVITFNNGNGISESDYDFLENDYVIDGLNAGLKKRVDDIGGNVEANTALIEQIEEDIKVNEGKYIPVQLSVQENKEFNFTTLEIGTNTNFQCAIVDVSEGEKYLISGFNQNSSIPLAVAYNSLTNDKIRLLNIGKNTTGVDEEATIPSGYDKMAINGHKSAPVGLKKYSNASIKLKNVVEHQSVIKANYPLFVAITDITNGKVISINKRFNEDKDVVWKFGNKPSNANNNFDFKEIGFVNRGKDFVSDKYLPNDGYEYLLGHNTDYILAMQIYAVNNRDGDFPDNTSLFTGGFHGYNNATESASATMREISKKIYADGKELSYGDSTYCRTCKIVVINNIQGSNTEKEDGSGREILEQKIIVDADENNMIVSIEYTALEDVVLYGISGLAQYLDFDKVRFIGSHSRLSEYDKGTLVRVSNDDKGTVAIRNYGNDYLFEVGIDKTYGIGDSYYNLSSPNALITTANKGYFELIVHSNPLSLSQGESVQVKGYFKFEQLFRLE